MMERDKWYRYSVTFKTDGQTFDANTALQGIEQACIGQDRTIFYGQTLAVVEDGQAEADLLNRAVFSLRQLRAVIAAGQLGFAGSTHVRTADKLLAELEGTGL